MESVFHVDVPKVRVMKPSFSQYEREVITVKATSRIIPFSLCQMHPVSKTLLCNSSNRMFV